MRLGVQPSFSIAEAARACGLNYRTILRHGEAGHIEIVRRGGRYVVDRHELIRYLKANNYDPSLWRPQVQPAGGTLLIAGPAPDLPYDDLAGLHPTICPSVLALGRRLGSEPVWAVVLDFHGLGRATAVEVAAELRAGDAPLLVAVTAEDERAGAEHLRHFDLLIARPVNHAGLVQGLHSLRRLVDQLAPGQPTAGRGKRRRRGAMTHV